MAHGCTVGGATNDKSQIQLDFDTGVGEPVLRGLISGLWLALTGLRALNGRAGWSYGSAGCEIPVSRVRSLRSSLAAISIALRRERILGVCSYH